MKYLSECGIILCDVSLATSAQGGKRSLGRVDHRSRHVLGAASFT